jgi:nuclear transport factor 2 (NTF2) superfamily protein
MTSATASRERVGGSAAINDRQPLPPFTRETDAPRWCFDEDRFAVRFQCECRDRSGQWWRSYGNELWPFDQHGPTAPPAQ